MKWQGWHKTGPGTLFSLWSPLGVTNTDNENINESISRSSGSRLVVHIYVIFFLLQIRENQFFDVMFENVKTSSRFYVRRKPIP